MKVVIVDDHILFREAVKALIGAEKDIQVIGFAGTVQEAVEITCREKPDLILMDYYLPDGTGADAIRSILAEWPDCKIIVLSGGDADEALFDAIRSGASGYLLKSIHPQKLVASIRSVFCGEAALSRSMTLRVMDELAHTEARVGPDGPHSNTLTRRERELLCLISAGMSNKEISHALSLSLNTVKRHLQSIYDKLGVSNRRDAAYYAAQMKTINYG